MKLIQHQYEVYVEGYIQDSIIEIKYSGTIVGEMSTDSAVIFTKDKIIIFKVENGDSSFKLFDYEGNFKIKRAYYLSNGYNKVGIPTTYYSEEWQNLYGRNVWEDMHKKWEDFNYSYKDIHNLKSTLRFRKNGRLFQYSNGRLSPFLRVGKTERKIFENIKRKEV